MGQNSSRGDSSKGMRGGVLASINHQVSIDIMTDCGIPDFCRPVPVNHVILTLAFVTIVVSTYT